MKQKTLITMGKINIAEILKNCPKGMELDCAMWDGVTFEKVQSGNYPIRIRIKDAEDVVADLTEFGEWNYTKASKCVIFPKGKTTWEGFVPPCKFKDGDIIYTLLESNFEYISIFQKASKTRIYSYVDLGSQLYTKHPDGLCLIDNITSQRLATKEEKQKLFQAIKDNGYRWNTKTKTLEKLMIDPIFKVGDKIVEKNGVYTPILIANVDNEYYYFNTKDSVGIIPILNQDRYELVPNKFDINTLVPFESRVLIRDYNTSMWLPSLWGIYIDNDNSSYPYKLIGTVSRYCIPYEGNEHLIGKTDDCNDFYKTWE